MDSNQEAAESTGRDPKDATERSASRAASAAGDSTQSSCATEGADDDDGFVDDDITPREQAPEGGDDDDNDSATRPTRPAAGHDERQHFVLEFDAADFKKPRRKVVRKKTTAPTADTSTASALPAGEKPTKSKAKAGKAPSEASTSAAAATAATVPMAVPAVSPPGAPPKATVPSCSRSMEELAMDAAARRVINRQKGIGSDVPQHDYLADRQRGRPRVTADHDPRWLYQPPPNNKRTLFFVEEWPPPTWAAGRAALSRTGAAEDPDFPVVYHDSFIVLCFSSDFDSGNLIQVERTAPYVYNLYSCPDCGNSPVQTNNKQWYHWSVRGLPRGVTVKVTMVGLANSKMYTFGWVPVAATVPLTSDARTAILTDDAAEEAAVGRGEEERPAVSRRRPTHVFPDDAAVAALAADPSAPFSSDTYRQALAVGPHPVLYARMAAKDAKAVVSQTAEQQITPGYPNLGYKPVVCKFPSSAADATDVTGEGGGARVANASFAAAVSKIAQQHTRHTGVSIIPHTPEGAMDDPFGGRAMSGVGPQQGGPVLFLGCSPPLSAVTGRMGTSPHLLSVPEMSVSETSTMPPVSPPLLPSASIAGGSVQARQESASSQPTVDADDDDEATAARKGKPIMSYNISYDVTPEADLPFVPTTTAEREALCLVLTRYVGERAAAGGALSQVLAAAAVRPLSPFPLGHNRCPAYYSAGNHPYSYGRACRHLMQWRAGVLAHNSTTTATLAACSADDGSATGPTLLCPVSGRTLPVGGIYYNEEVLCRSLDRHDVHLITITGIDKDTDTGPREPLVATFDTDSPTSLSEGPSPTSASEPQHRPLPARLPSRGQRPYIFLKKKYIVVSARVHPGETPASYLMHGLVDFFLHPTDPRAARLRERCVLVVIPIINPDGVFRGHSRADTTGQNLNRCYRDPAPIKHPAPFAIRQLLLQLRAEDRLHLFIDMHAHANKKGTFVYGNAMDAPAMAQNLLYAKLVSLNSPFFEFSSSNFSETNMFAMGKTGESKDCSSRVTIFQDTGLVHSYTIEANYVSASLLNPVVAVPGLPNTCPPYTTGQLFVSAVTLASPALSSMSPAASQLAGALGIMPGPREGGRPEDALFVIPSNAPPSEAADVPPASTMSLKYAPHTHADVGRALLLAFADQHNLLQDTPYGRLALTTFRTERALRAAIGRYLVTDVVEAMRRQVMRRCGLTHGEFFAALKAVSAGGSRAVASPHEGRLALLPGDLPTCYTHKGSKTFPPTTIFNVGSLATTAGGGGKAAKDREGPAEGVLWGTYLDHGDNTLSHGFCAGGLSAGLHRAASQPLLGEGASTQSGDEGGGSAPTRRRYLGLVSNATAAGAASRGAKPPVRPEAVPSAGRRASQPQGPQRLGEGRRSSSGSILGGRPPAVSSAAAARRAQRSKDSLSSTQGSIDT